MICLKTHRLSTLFKNYFKNATLLAAFKNIFGSNIF